MIRQAVRGDAAAIAAIWNPLIRDTLVTFQPHPRTPAEIAALITARAGQGHPFLVAHLGRDIHGFATYAQFRPGPGYAKSMEHTVILDPSQQGRGLGRKLMVALEDHARIRGVRVMVGAITADNADSLLFHARLGYAEVGRMPQVGWKFGRHHDLVLMQKLLQRRMGDSPATG